MQKIKIIMSTQKDSNSFWNSWTRNEVSIEWLITKLTNHKKVNVTMEEYTTYKKLLKQKTKENEENRSLIKQGLEPIKTETEQILIDLEKKNPHLSNVKDWGSFIPCESKDRFHEKSNKYVPSKHKADILNQTALKLDIDDCDLTVYEQLKNIKNLAIVYSTFSHTVDRPKLRVILPLKEALKPDEFVYVTKKYIDLVGLTGVDEASWRIQQIMYFPSCPKDGIVYTDVIQGDLLDGKAMLNEGWNVVPETIKETKAVERKRNPKGYVFGDTKKTKSTIVNVHPFDIKGIRGDFNRMCGNIKNAIEMFIPEIYQETSSPDRLVYSFRSSAGALLYPHANDITEYQFMYSHHSSDFVYQTLVDSYELVLAHLYNAHPDQKGTVEYKETKNIFDDYIKSTHTYMDFKIEEIQTLGHEELSETQQFYMDKIEVLLFEAGINVVKKFLNNGEFYLTIENKGKIYCYVNIQKENVNFYYPYNKDRDYRFEDKLYSTITQNKPCDFNLETELLIKDLKNHLQIPFGREFIDRSGMKFYHPLLIKDTQVLAGTGAGKTHESAKRILYNVLFTNTFTIFATKENENVRDCMKEIYVVIDKYCTWKSQRVLDFLENEESLNMLGIVPLTSKNRISIDNIPAYKAIITNHSYFSVMGDTIDYNIYMTKILEDSRQKDFIFDEFECYKKKLQTIIPLNNFVYDSVDRDDHLNNYKASTCLFRSDSNIISKDDKLYYPIENIRQELKKIESLGVEKYKLSPHGKKNLQDEFNRSTIKKSTEFEVDDKDYIVLIPDLLAYKFIYKLEEMELTEYEFNETNFIKLLKLSNGVSKGTLIISFEFKGEEYLIESVDKLEEFLRTKIQYPENIIDIKNTLYQANHFTSASDLFVEKAILNIKSILEIDGIDKSLHNYYYISANEVEGLELPIDRRLEYLSSPDLEKIKFITFNSKKGNDKLLMKVAELSKDNPYKSLLFFAYKSNHDLLYKTKFEWVAPKGKNDDNPNANQTTGRIMRGTEIIDIPITTITSYINGSETQGKNYSYTEFLGLNLEISQNVNSRIYYDYIEKKNKILPIEVAKKKLLFQGVGRILRVKDGTKVKYVLLIGDTESDILNEVLDHYNQFNFDIEVLPYTKAIHSKHNPYDKALSDVLTYVKADLGNCNRGESNDLTALDFNKDERKQAKKSKTNKDEIIQKFKENKTLSNKDFFETIIKPQYGIGEATFKRYIKNI